jgi:thiamine transporter ThiT
MLNLCGIVVAILKMATGRNFSMLPINSGHHYLLTYQILMISDNVHHNTAKIQHCLISKVAFDLFFKPVVSGRFGRLHNR